MKPRPGSATALRILAPALALASILAPALPPGTAVAQEASFQEVTEIIEVQVPVNVSTRDGQPVRGLTAESFEVYDRGKKQVVSGFDVVDLDVLDPEILHGPAALQAVIPAAARRHFLLLFDLTFAAPASVTKAREAAHDFVLEELHPTDLVSVATFSLDVGPRLLVTFTPDRAQLARAIDTLGAPRLLDQNGVVDPLRFMIEDPLRASMSSTFGEGGLQERAVRGRGSERSPPTSRSSPLRSTSWRRPISGAGSARGWPRSRRWPRSWRASRDASTWSSSPRASTAG
jgi:hypothetical protein